MIIRTKFVRVRGPGPDAKFIEPLDIDVNTHFDRRFNGRVGRIVGYSAKGDLVGVGDSPQDPVYHVKFGPAYGMQPTENLFWTEELEPVRRARRARRTP